MEILGYDFWKLMTPEEDGFLEREETIEVIACAECNQEWEESEMTYYKEKGDPDDYAQPCCPDCSKNLDLNEYLIKVK